MNRMYDYDFIDNEELTASFAEQNESGVLDGVGENSFYFYIYRNDIRVASMSLLFEEMAPNGELVPAFPDWLSYLQSIDKPKNEMNEIRLQFVSHLLDYMQSSEVKLSLVPYYRDKVRSFSAHFAIPFRNINKNTEVFVESRLYLMNHQGTDVSKFMKKWMRYFSIVSGTQNPVVQLETWEIVGMLHVEKFVKNHHSFTGTIDYLVFMKNYPQINELLKELYLKDSLLGSRHIPVNEQAVNEQISRISEACRVAFETMSEKDAILLEINVIVAMMLMKTNACLLKTLYSEIMQSCLNEQIPKNYWESSLQIISLVDEALPDIPEMKKLFITYNSFVSTMFVSLTSQEWPTYKVRNEEAPGYRSWSRCEIPLFPWGAENEIENTVEKAKHYGHLYSFLDWAEYHWLFMFNNIKSFWIGSNGGSAQYLNSEIKRDRAIWTATSLAETTQSNDENGRQYTFPSNGIIIDLKFGGIPDALGLSTLYLVEKEPGTLFFVAQNKKREAVVGRWHVEKPTKLEGFVRPFTDITEDDELLLAVCISSVFYDLVSTRTKTMIVKSVSRNSENWLNAVGRNEPTNPPQFSRRDLRGGLDRVSYQSKTIDDGLERQKKARHGVIGHPRWQGPSFILSPDRRKTSDAHHVYIPPGYTFVKPHNRGGDSKETVERLTKIVGLHRLMLLEIEQPAL